MADLTGQTFAGCEIVSELGRGGMGAVYKARQALLNRFVALKVMVPKLAEDPAYVARFIREAASAASLSHPNMVQVHTAGEQNGLYYIVMEFVEGHSLRDHIASHGQIDPHEAIAITVYTAQALQYAWNKAKLIHRDIKPGNIFLSNTNEVKVGDLGLAKSVGESAADVTSTGITVGSPHYISPEQALAKKDIDFRSDIYSLGCTLYHMLTGRTPYDGDSSMEIVMKHVHDLPPPVMEVWPQCPEALGRLVGKMLAKNRNERHASYEELIAELFAVTETIAQLQSASTAALAAPRVSAGEPTQAASQVRAVPCTVRAVSPKKKSPAAVYAMAGVATVVMLAGLMIWSPWNTPSSQYSKTPILQDSISSTPTLQHSPTLKLLGNVFTNSVGAEMVYVPPGEFMMGSTKEEQAWAMANGLNEEDMKREGKAPRKTRIKDGFWMGRTEVTVGQWKQFVNATGYKTDAEKNGYADQAPQKNQMMGRVDGLSWRDPGFGTAPQDNHAVCCVSWCDAVTFCEWLTARERKAGRLAADLVVRLPTDAEWEYACRAGTQTKFWWGDLEEDGRGRLNWAGKFDGFEFVAPVDSFGWRGRNDFGLADMLGNVYEWCLDKFDETQTPENLWTNRFDARVLRGGSFYGSTARDRSAYRICFPLDHSLSFHGFRIVMAVNVSGPRTSTSSASSAAAPKEGGILAPPETRVSALTANPKVGEVFTLNIGSNVTMELMGIPPGEFMMGSTKEEQEWAIGSGLLERYVSREGEAPRKAVIRSGFWMGQTEVTVGQWKEFVTATGYKTGAEEKGFVDGGPPHKGQALSRVVGLSWLDPGFGSPPHDGDAVTCINWNDAVAFCKWLTERERKAGRLSASRVVRLPTEAEWEYACRAGTQTKFWWGESIEDGKGRLNWSGKDDGYEFIAPVDSYGARGRNGFGLADMLGNVWEWCLDEFDPKQPHEEYYKGNPRERVLRGGAFPETRATCRCAFHPGFSPTYSDSRYGFRVVVGVDVSGATMTTTSTSSATASKKTGILAPPETRVPALTTNPKVGEVYTLNVGSNVTMELMGIPPGEFMLGSTKEEQAWALANGGPENNVKCEGEAPRKAAIKQGFWMGRTEVTVGQWKQFVKETDYVTDAEKKGESHGRLGTGKWGPVKGMNWKNPKYFSGVNDQAVTCISWNDAMVFCKWLTDRELKAGRLPVGMDVRLPTEAEWEYACRAGTQTKFWWGDNEEDGMGRLSWAYSTTGVALVDSCGQRGQNGFGLADMLGNAWELCLDEFDETKAHEECYKDKFGRRVMRGGSFTGTGSGNRCATRAGGSDSSGAGWDGGFRICCGIAVSDATTTTASSSPAAVSKEAGVLAPPETRVAALTTNPKVGEVFTLNVGSNVTMELMGIPRGGFMLGSTKEEQAWAVTNFCKMENAKIEGEVPRKAAIKQGFWIGRTEVTVGQWKQFVKETGYVTDGEKKSESYVYQGPGKPFAPMKGKNWRDPNFGFEMQDNHPVCCISWNDAVAFCEWLTQQERKVGRLATGMAVRLPTEVEWEYACRAGRQTKWWWGDLEEDGKDRLNWAGKDDRFEFVAPVDSYGKRGRNGFGLADMLGNVWEWCLDGFDAAQAHEDLWTGNLGVRVARGGSFCHNSANCRCAIRTSYHPVYSLSHYGFRVSVGLLR